MTLTYLDKSADSATVANDVRKFQIGKDAFQHADIPAVPGRMIDKGSRILNTRRARIIANQRIDKGAIIIAAVQMIPRRRTSRLAPCGKPQMGCDKFRYFLDRRVFLGPQAGAFMEKLRFGKRHDAWKPGERDAQQRRTAAITSADKQRLQIGARDVHIALLSLRKFIGKRQEAVITGFSI